MVMSVDFLSTRYLQSSDPKNKQVNYEIFLDDYDRLEKEGLGLGVSCLTQSSAYEN